MELDEQPYLLYAGCTSMVEMTLYVQMLVRVQPPAPSFQILVDPPFTTYYNVFVR